MQNKRFSGIDEVNCRIGSLETCLQISLVRKIVNCRIGSLEIVAVGGMTSNNVNCRIGSLERDETR